MTQKAATQFGENNINIQKAIRAIVPVIMKGFASKAAEGNDKASQLFVMADEATSSTWWQQFTNWFSNGDMLQKGEEILNDLFGNKNTDRIAAQIAAETQIQPASAHALMQWVAPLCIGALGKYSSDNELNAAGMAAFLSKEKIHFETNTPQQTLSTPQASAPVATQAGSGNAKGKLWIPALLLLLIAGLAWYYIKGCNHENDNIAPVAPVTDTTAKVPETPAPAIQLPTASLNPDSTITYSFADTVTLDLPGGTSLRVPQNSTEALLISKIKEVMANGVDTSAAGKSASWINLYAVQFVKNTDYRAGASEQLSNIAAILKAYPTVKIKIGGYTDNTGSDAINTKISQARADKVMKDLTSAGTGAQLDKADGYGPQFPVADNATPQGRAQNRRVSCRIVSVSK